MIKRTVANTLNELLGDIDFGKIPKNSFMKSLVSAKAERGRSMTVKQFREQYGF